MQENLCLLNCLSSCVKLYDDLFMCSYGLTFTNIIMVTGTILLILASTMITLLCYDRFKINQGFMRYRECGCFINYKIDPKHQMLKRTENSTDVNGKPIKLTNYIIVPKTNQANHQIEN